MLAGVEGAAERLDLDQPLPGERFLEAAQHQPDAGAKRFVRPGRRARLLGGFGRRAVVRLAGRLVGGALEVVQDRQEVAADLFDEPRFQVLPLGFDAPPHVGEVRLEAARQVLDLAVRVVEFVDLPPQLLEVRRFGGRGGGLVGRRLPVGGGLVRVLGEFLLGRPVRGVFFPAPGVLRGLFLGHFVRGGGFGSGLGRRVTHAMEMGRVGLGQGAGRPAETRRGRRTRFLERAANAGKPFRLARPPRAAAPRIPRRRRPVETPR